MDTELDSQRGRGSDGEPALIAWSGGKDCTLALREAHASPDLRVTGLLTTVTDEYDRISMHGVRRSLLHRQARALGLPLLEVPIPPDCPNTVYEERMAAAVAAAVDERGIGTIVYGDLFLADIREYRERQLAPLGVRPFFPLWGQDTHALARRFIDDGFRAIVCVVDPRQLDAEFVGRDYDHRFLDELPEGVDPCGENGEFHTFVHDGPLFDRAVSVERGEVVERGGFRFCDLRSPPDAAHA